MRITILFILSLFFVHNVIIAERHIWKAERITAFENQNMSNTWINFKRKIKLDSIFTNVIAKIACDSKYWLWINGELVVFEGGLKRGPNPDDTYYDEVKIDKYLKVGENNIALLVWYFGKDSFSHKSSGQAGLVFECERINLYSDTSWLAKIDNAFGTADDPLPNFRLSESNIRYDANYGSFDWINSDSLGLGFSKAKVLGEAESAPWNKLIPRPIPLFRNYGLKSFVSQTRNGDTLICDLPYNMQFTPYIKINSTANQKIILATDNYFYFNGSSHLIRGEYITCPGIQEYESLGWMNGHKFYCILPKHIELISVMYRESGYDTDISGHFTCSDSFFNDLWKKSARTLYLTMRDNYMDCPDRERAQWAGDAVNESGETFYALSTSSHALIKKWLHEFVDWQRSDSIIISPTPSGNWDVELPCQILMTISQFGAWNYYLNTGDIQTIKYVYPAFKRYVGLWQFEANVIVKVKKADWIWGDWGENKDIKLIYNLLYYMALDGMRNIASAINLPHDADQFQKKLIRLKQVINNYFWNGKEYRTPDYVGRTDDRPQALAVLSGVAGEDKYRDILKVLQTEAHASPYMEKYIFEAMMKMNCVDEALNRQKIRFGKMVNNSYFTTLFEGWGWGTEGYGGGTVNHAWSGGALTVLSQYVCGIAPVKPGYDTFTVLPQLGYLNEAATSFETVKGKITVSIKKTETTFSINVLIPLGSNAIMGIPAKRIKSIRVNNKLIWQRGKFYDPGYISNDKISSSRIGLSLQAGNWEIVAQK